MLNLYNRIISFLVSAVFLFTERAGAQFPTPILPVSSGSQLSIAKLVDMVNQVARFLISVAPVIAVIYIIWGGITYMAAGPDEEKVSRAKVRIKNAIIGTIIVFGIGLILSTISNFIGTLTLYR